MGAQHQPRRLAIGAGGDAERALFARESSALAKPRHASAVPLKLIKVAALPDEQATCDARCAAPPLPMKSPMNLLKRNNVEVLGDRGPVLLYAHGFGCNREMWNHILPAFAETHRQVVFDYVGSGNSDRTAFDPLRYANLTGYARDVLDVCDALGLTEDVTFVGHSVSCSIGMLASIQRPALFNRLILIGPSPSFLNDPPAYLGGFEPEDLEGLLTLLDQNYMGWAQYLAPVVAGASGGDAVAGTLNESFCSTDPAVARVFARATFFADNRADLHRVPVPSLLLQHRKDSLAPLGVGEYMHAQMPQSTLRVLDVEGHCAHLSNPALVIEAMQQYLAPAAAV
ncbi:alpha/beta fold hydrolase [Roseateles hydrophilus]|uniref:alpha/beta fold hydrolase n=1 Tax=Roseateles hydrophilus TaxID=2975054 RepID=UPI00227BC7EA|nr:alpha/beta hydrolase [Pelomonas sp. UHG3]